MSLCVEHLVLLTIIYYAGKSSPGLEQVSRNLSNILEKALDERVEKEFLSTQEETLTSIPEDPETEADIVDEPPTFDEESAQQTTTSTPTTAATTTATATSTAFVETEQTMVKDSFLIESPTSKPSGKLAVGNGSAILHNQLNHKPSTDDDDNNNNNKDKIDDKVNHVPSNTNHLTKVNHCNGGHHVSVSRVANETDHDERHDQSQTSEAHALISEEVPNSTSVKAMNGSGM